METKYGSNFTREQLAREKIRQNESVLVSLRQRMWRLIDKDSTDEMQSVREVYEMLQEDTDVLREQARAVRLNSFEIESYYYHKIEDKQIIEINPKHEFQENKNRLITLIGSLAIQKSIEIKSISFISESAISKEQGLFSPDSASEPADFLLEARSILEGIRALPEISEPN